MAADITGRAQTVPSVRRRLPTFGLSWRILGLVVVAVMTAEVLIFLPSIARFRLVYLSERIESGTLAALALDEIEDRKSTRLNSSHRCISYAVFCLKKKNSR